jgi:hypothetical protein
LGVQRKREFSAVWTYPVLRPESVVEEAALVETPGGAVVQIEKAVAARILAREIIVVLPRHEASQFFSLLPRAFLT